MHLSEIKTVYDAIAYTPYGLWLSRIPDRIHGVTVALLTPTRMLDFYSWAINKRTYGIILASLQPEEK
jgi:hypothetical protein